MDAKDVIERLRSEIHTGDIKTRLLDACPGLTPDMASVMVAGILAKALTFGYALPSVIDEYITTWKEVTSDE
jgi:hypothetical protein